MSCRASPRRLFRALMVGSVVSFLGFFGLLLTFLLIRFVFLLLYYSYLPIVILRFGISGTLILLWLYLWWEGTVLLRNLLLSRDRAYA